MLNCDINILLTYGLTIRIILVIVYLYVDCMYIYIVLHTLSFATSHTKLALSIVLYKVSTQYVSNTSYWLNIPRWNCLPSHDYFSFHFKLIPCQSLGKNICSLIIGFYSVDINSIWFDLGSRPVVLNYDVLSSRGHWQPLTIGEVLCTSIVLPGFGNCSYTF